MGSPIRKSTDIADICSSPWLIAACHVLLRLLMPRHSPCALSSLTASSQALYRSSPRSRGASLAPLLLLFLANPFHWASLGEGDAGLRPCFDGLKRLFGSLRIMQAILQDFEIVIVTLHLLRCVPQLKLSFSSELLSERPSVALLITFILRCSVFKVRSRHC